MSLALLAALVLLRPEPEAEVVVVGDIMLGRGVARRFPDGRAFEHVRPHLRGDLVLGNLECVLTTRPFVSAKRYRLRASPKTATALAEAGFTALNLANNHTQDAGLGGLQDTVEALELAGVVPVGLAKRPAQRFTVQGLRVSVVGGADVPTRSGGSTAVAERQALLRAVRRERPWADAILVLVHWGVENQPRPDPRTVRFGRELVGAGADLVAASGPHVSWPVERVRQANRQGLVAYSLGNFVFDAPPGPTREGLILKVRVGRAGVLSHRIIPVHLDRGAPVPSDSPARPR